MLRPLRKRTSQSLRLEMRQIEERRKQLQMLRIQIEKRHRRELKLVVHRTWT